VWLAERDAVIDGQPGDIVSLLPLSQRVTGITTEGLEYPLRGETLRLGPARGVSNVMLGKMARVAHRSGLLLIMHGPGAEGRQQA
jgi:thiamine pyrophosphokinase